MLLPRLRLRRAPDAEREAHQVLTELDRRQITVRVEIENTPLYFFSRLSLRSGGVVLGRPRAYEKLIKPGVWLRLRTGLAEAQELRLAVSSPKFGTGDNPYFLCRLPGAVTTRSKRNDVRLSTIHFKNLGLTLAGHSTPYRVLDISRNGVRVRLRDSGQEQKFPLNAAPTRGTLHLGSKARIPLENVIPRHLDPGAVGLEMSVRPQSRGNQYLELFLDSLQKGTLKTKQQATRATAGLSANGPEKPAAASAGAAES